MSIEFHCPQCTKKIKAPDKAGGQRGKCPHCHQEVYIPTPPDEIEPLDLAPVDEQEEQERQKAMEETRRLQFETLRDRSGGGGAADSGPSAPSGGGRVDPPVDMDTLLVQYAKAMADGRLDEAEEFAAEIRKDMSRAEDSMQRLVSDEMLSAQLGDIPRPVLNAFFKQLRSGG